MKVYIESVKLDCISVLSEYGVFECQWNGPLPTAGEIYFVEIDSDKVIEQSDIKESELNIPKIMMQDSQVCIFGYLEDWQDDLLFIRLDNSIFMLSANPNQSYIRFVNQNVSITLPELKVFPHLQIQ